MSRWLQEKILNVLRRSMISMIVMQIMLTNSKYETDEQATLHVNFSAGNAAGAVRNRFLKYCCIDFIVCL